MEEEEEKEELKVEALNSIENVNQLDSLSIEQNIKEIKKKKKKNCCHFPSAHTVLLILEVVVFILTYIIPKGKYNCIKYVEEKDIFEIYTYDKNGKKKKVD